MKKDLLKQRLVEQRAHITSVITAAGGQTQLAAVLGVSQAAISKWLMRGWLPVGRARECEALFGVSRTSLADPALVDALLNSSEMFDQTTAH